MTKPTDVSPTSWVTAVIGALAIYGIIWLVLLAWSILPVIPWIRV